MKVVNNTLNQFPGQLYKNRNDKYMMNHFTTCKNPTVVKFPATSPQTTMTPWKSTSMESVQNTRT